ncbi:MAG: hypothetical protein ACTSXF_08295 [Promethearchaeota archaeon]
MKFLNAMNTPFSIRQSFFLHFTPFLSYNFEIHSSDKNTPNLLLVIKETLFM